MVMVKSLVQIVTHLQERTTYASFKAWLLAVEDCVSSHTPTLSDSLGLVTIHTMAYLTISPDIHSWLETYGTLGIM